MSRLGKFIWADLEVAMHLLTTDIRAADLAGMEAGAEQVRGLATELRDAVREMRSATSLKEE